MPKFESATIFAMAVRAGEEISDHHDHLIDLSTGRVIEFINARRDRLRKAAWRRGNWASTSSTTDLSCGVPWAARNRSRLRNDIATPRAAGPDNLHRRHPAVDSGAVARIGFTRLGAEVPLTRLCRLIGVRIPFWDPRKGGVLMTANHTGGSISRSFPP
jgi:hypothetical protein